MPTGMPSKKRNLTCKAKGTPDEGNPENENNLVPITYYPIATQKHFSRMKLAIADKPYAHYFNSDLHLTRDALPALHQPMHLKNVLPLSQASKLLVKKQELASENGWYAFPDGTAYVASITHFPGATGEMVDWWFWWHSIEAERYALWYPYNHGVARSSYATTVRRGNRKPLLFRDDLPHRDRWLGSTHTVSEFIGPQLMTIRIQFVDPGYYGLPWDKLNEAGYEAAVCAVLWDATLPMKVGDFLHLWRRKDDGSGLELRSRYWLAHEVYIDVFGLSKISVDWLGGALGIKQRLAGETVAYEQFLHDQIEFTNLASILPRLYDEFGKPRGEL